jgi:hypothetical protein
VRGEAASQIWHETAWSDQVQKQGILEVEQFKTLKVFRALADNQI